MDLIWIDEKVRGEKIDTLIFDIDGVLIDTRFSYSESIRVALDIFFKEILNFVGPPKFVSYEEIEMFKLSGGFNNEWNILKAIAVFYIAKSIKYNSRDLGLLIDKEPKLKVLFGELKESGGGFDTFLKLLEGYGLPVDEVSYDEERLIRLGMESYAGRYTKLLYGFSPQYFKDKGAIDEEKPLLKDEFLDVVKKYKLGVLTGRLREEVDIIKPKIKLFELIDDKFILTNSEIPDKPNPKGLEILKERLGFQKAVFIGDTMDDYRVTENYNRKVGKKEVFSCMVLSRGTEKDAKVRFDTYREIGAAFVFPTVNEFLKYMRDEHGKQ